MESLCVVVRENAGELVDSARLSWDAKCGEAAAGIVRGFSAGPPGTQSDSGDLPQRARVGSVTLVAGPSCLHRATSMQANFNRCLVLSALLASSLTAQNPLLAEVGEAIPDGFGQLIAAADYEGDGDVDLFSTSGVFLNDGGFFRPGPTMPAAFDPTFNVRSAEVADFNGDGLVDLMLGRLGGTPSGLVLLAAPAGAGTAFVASAALPVGGTGFFEFAAADVDLDGDVDVVVGNTSLPSSWQLLLNDGVGNFTFATTTQWLPDLPTNMSWLATGDFNGDGFPDLFASTFAGSIWRNNLGGTAFSASLVAGPSFVAETGTVGDFNGDGFDDVFMGESGGGEALYVGSPNGLILSGSIIGSILGAPPVAADRDGDGFDELLRSVTPVSGGSVAELFVLPGTSSGPGTGVSLGLIHYAYTNVSPYPGMAVLDVDGDGDLDTVVAPGGMSPYVLLQDSSGGHAFAKKIIPPQLETLYLPPRDVDGDGDADLITHAFANGQVTLLLWRNDGRGDFGTAPVVAGSFTAAIPMPPTWADLDNDGDDDFWVGSLFVTSPSLVMLNNGAGLFTVGTSINNIGHTVTRVIADFNGDAIKDVVMGRPAMSVFPPIMDQPLLITGSLVAGGVSYSPPVPFGLPALIIDMVVVDPDQDGDNDILVATYGSLATPGPVYLYQNDGLGNFTALPPFPGVQAATVAAGDLNGDGIEDVVIGGQTWLGNGTTYLVQGLHAAPVDLVSLADLDEDGDLDLFDRAGRWYPGDGAGNFGAPIQFVPYAPELSVPSGGGRVPLDLDGDGDLDTIGPNTSGSGHLSLYANLTRHAAATSLATPNLPLGVAVYGKPNELWFLGLSFPPTGGIALPGFGTLFLNPANMLVWSAGLLGPSARADVSVVIPPNGAGFTYSWQALVGQPLRFSNGFDTPIAF